MQRLHELFRDHPAPASDAGDEAFAFVQSAAECTHTCTACADACLEEDDPTHLRECIRTNLDCADICTATARLISRPGKQDPDVLRAQLEACATVCRACAEHCEKHGESMEHCRVCAESCRECAEACDRMLEALVAA